MPEHYANAKASWLPILQDWGLAVVLTLLVLSPLFLMRVTTRSRNTPKPEPRRPVTVLPEADSQYTQESKGIQNIYAWVRLQRPEILFRPESELGFKTQIQGIAHKTALDFMLSPLHPISLLAEQDYLPTPSIPALLGNSSPVEQKTTPIQTTWEAPVTPELPEVQPVTPPYGIFWRDLSGRKLLNPPPINEDAVKEILKTRPLQGEITCLEAIPFAGMHRVAVRASCSVPELDNLAVEALKARLADMRYAGGHLPSDTLLLEVIWRFK